VLLGGFHCEDLQTGFAPRSRFDCHACACARIGLCHTANHGDSYSAPRPGVVGSCPGFDVTATFDTTRRITTFYNAEGTPIRQQIHAEVPGTVTNAVTGKSLPTIGVRNITTDLSTGEMKSTATNVHIVVPGQGTVQLAAGLFEIDGDGNLVKEVGRQDPPVTPALCAALA